MKEIRIDSNKSCTAVTTQKVVTDFADVTLKTNDTIKMKLDCASKDEFLNAKIDTETKRATERESELESQIVAGGKVTDVTVDGSSVVKEKVAEIELQPIRDSVSSEAARAQSAEASISASVSSLQSDLSAETSRATAREDELEKAISEGGKIQDVKVDGESVVTDKVANIDLQPVWDSISSEAARAAEAEEKLAADLSTEVSARKSVVEALQTGIDAEVARAKEAEDKIIEDASSSFRAVDDEIEVLNSSVEAIEDKIPSQASPDNQLADKDYVNSSIATSTATFRGTVDSLDALKALAGDLNDYAFVEVKDETTGLTLRYDRYKYSETSSAETGNWAFEYTLNNSSFTSDQWKAITSGITSDLVTQIATNKDAIAQETADREDAIYNVELNLDEEITRAKAEESALSESISSEAARATAKETELETAISQAGKIDDVQVNGTSVVSDKVANIDLTSYVLKAGDTMTGALNVPVINDQNANTAITIATGTNSKSYFQSRKFRGQGDANTYNHAIDFGYSGHDRMDFYEYGGVFNFWANRGSSKLEGDNNRVASLQHGKILERGNTLTYPGKSGTFALTDDVAEGDTQTLTDAKAYSDDNYRQVFLRYSANQDGSGMTEKWQRGQKYIGAYVAHDASTDYKDYSWTQFVGDTYCETSTSTTVSLTLTDENDVSYTNDMASLTITVPSSVYHGFYSGVNFKTGSTIPTVAFTNSSSLPLKLVLRGLAIDTYTPKQNITCQMMFYCDGINVYCYMNEV